MQDSNDTSTTDKTEGDVKLKKLIFEWMSYLQLQATRICYGMIRQIKKTAVITWQHFRSLLDYGVAAWGLRSSGKRASAARLETGEQFHRLNQGDESLRKQIDDLDNQLETLKQASKPTRKLEREKKNLLVQLGS